MSEELKYCICGDPENCTEPVPGRICKREVPCSPPASHSEQPFVQGGEVGIIGGAVVVGASHSEAGGGEKHARYENGWYYCWLVEKRGGPQPEWLGADCFWHTNAQLAEWYARKSDADTVAAEMLDINVVACEHAFQLDDKGNP